MVKKTGEALKVGEILQALDTKLQSLFSKKSLLICEAEREGEHKQNQTQHGPGQVQSPGPKTLAEQWCHCCILSGVVSPGGIQEYQIGANEDSSNIRTSKQMFP